MSDEVVFASAEYRSSRRVPALSFLHSNGAALCRCAQPLSGVLLRRSAGDEALVKAFFSANPNQVKSAHIFDARPRANAFANMVAGKGFETPHYYGTNVILSFLNIENIHQVRSAKKALDILCRDIPTLQREYGAIKAGVPSAEWTATLLDTSWPFHISAVLNGGMVHFHTL